MGPPADLDGLLLGKTKPSTISVSSTVPPNFFVTLISLKSTLVLLFFSIILKTESTAKGDNSLELVEITFELKAVLTVSINLALSYKSTFSEIVSKISKALFYALINPSEIDVGWIDLDNNFSQADNKDPAITATEVVPSPASIS